MDSVQVKVNEVFDFALYLQLMGAFTPHSDFQKIKEIVLSIREFINTSNREEIELKLPTIKISLEEMSNVFIEKYPIKASIPEISTKWNELFEDGENVFSNGLNYGWLEEFMDLSNLYPYNYVPYHFKIGLITNKGFGTVEEDFLLKDSFNVLIKAEYYFSLLNKYGEIVMDSESDEITKETYLQMASLKYEVAAFSRLTIISFYSFIECFVNSIGYSFLQRNINRLDDKEKEVLSGNRKGSFLSLKSKIEKMQKIIRDDKKTVLITSDDFQIKEPFKSFFNDYEQLRNSAVHFSPNKQRIWMKPQDWLDKAQEFSKLSIEVGFQFWQACFPELGPPDYIGRLDYDLLLKLAKDKQINIQKIEIEVFKQME